MEVLICTGDRDALQLVTERTTVLYPRKGVSDLARMTPESVREKYGVPPEHYPDLAAIVGETSDNLPGVPGVGPGFASKWIQQYGSLGEVIAHADEITGKKGEAFRAHLAEVMRNRRLNALVRDLELSAGPAELTRRSWDRDAVHAVFDALEFRVLRDRLYATLTTAEPEAETGFDLDGRVLAPGELAGWLAEHAVVGERLGLALEGNWGRGTGDVSALALASRAGAAAWLVPSQLDAQDEAVLAAYLSDPAKPKALHDAKGPMLALAARGTTLAGVTGDTALAAYLLRPDQRSYDLADLALRYLQRELRTDEPGDGQLAFDAVEDDRAAEALMLRAAATVDLAEMLDSELATRNGTALLAEVELPLAGVLARMEQVGVAADAGYLGELAELFATGVRTAAEAAYAVIGREFNLGSPKQLQVILFDELELPKTKRIKTGYTTDADALQGLYAQTGHPLLEHLLRHRDVARLKSTVEGLLKTVGDDGRIHTTYNQTIAATGRLSSTDPNLQNIPIRTEEGRGIRRAFVVGAEYDTLLTADYSQIEMRIMAHLSKDEGLIDAFATGEDLHMTVASKVFSVPGAEVSPEMRRRIKAMSYGLAYGLSAYGLSQQLGITPDEARGLMEGYFERFGGVRDYLHGVVEQARKDGYTETILGRRRYLPDLLSDNRQRREMAERMALNAPIQGSAADIIKLAMLGIDRVLPASGLRSRLLLQVHDELVFEVAAGEAAELEKLVRREMGAAHALSVPLDVSVGSGSNWDIAGH
jgi:DNA polymerase-1